MKRVLITGAAGFIGRHMHQLFSARGARVVGVGRGAATPLAEHHTMTLPDPAFAELVGELSPDTLIHCAGWSSVATSFSDPYTAFRADVDSCACVLNALREKAPHCKFILLSSAAVYGEPERMPISEQAPRRPMSPYGYHKTLCEDLTTEYTRFFSIDSAILRVFSAYGEGLSRQVLYDLSCKFLDPDSRRVELIGNGTETRDFIHGRDVAQAAWHAAACSPGEIINVASGVATPISALAELIQRLLGTTKEITHSGRGRSGDPQQWRANITRLLELGFSPSIELSDGVSDYLRWLMDQRNITT